MKKIAMRELFAMFTVLILGSSSISASAADNVWKGSASGVTESILDEAGTNYDTFGGWGGGQLGNFTATGTHSINSDLSLTGNAIWVSADGQSLYVSFKGRVAIFEERDFPYHFTATLTVDGGTGRFAGATGSAVMNGGFSGEDGEFFFEFEGTLCTHGNYHALGTIEIESLGCGMGQITPYAMEAWSAMTGMNRQSGSILSTSAPVKDESNPDVTVWTFTAETGPNFEFFGLPLHIINTKDGLIICRWQAHFKIEIDHRAEGQAVMSCDGLMTVVSGTERYQTASGGWQMLFETEPSFGNGPVNGTFVMDGALIVPVFSGQGESVRRPRQNQNR